eukprot:1619478-Rhodomonas_salina.1
MKTVAQAVKNLRESSTSSQYQNCGLYVRSRNPRRRVAVSSVSSALSSFHLTTGTASTPPAVSSRADSRRSSSSLERGHSPSCCALQAFIPEIVTLAAQAPGSASSLSWAPGAGRHSLVSSAMICCSD